MSPRRGRAARARFARAAAPLLPWLLALALLLGAGAALLPRSGAAQGGTPVPAAADLAPGTVLVTPSRDEATADFPEGITFALTATAPFPVERVELLYRPLGDETRRMAAPDLPAGTGPSVEVAVEHEVDLRAGDLPPGIDLLYHWRLVGADGAEAETPEGRVAWRDDRFQWETLAGERASVHAYEGSEGLRREVLEVTEREIVRLEDLYGATLAAPVGVWLYGSTDALAGALRPNSEEWVAGAAFPRYNLILGVIRPREDGEIGRLIPHEVSHLVLGAATGNPFSEPPAWLDEGLATAQEEGDQGPYLRLVREALLDGELPSLPAIAGGFPFDTEGAQLAYAESLSIVTYILDRYGEAGVGRLVAAYREPRTDEQAVQQALGVTLAELEAGWRLALAEEAGAFAGTGSGGDGNGGDGFSLDPENALLVASGGLVMALAAVLAVVVGAVALRRARRTAFPDEDDGPEVEAAWRPARAPEEPPLTGTL